MKVCAEEENRYYFSAAKCAQTAVLITGGMIKSAGYFGLWSATNSVKMFDLNAQEWSDSVAMNQARYNHSSCFMGNSRLFVFGGLANSRKFLDSIEFMEVMNQKPWLLLRLKEFGHRAFPAVIALNDTKIAILGGLCQT